MKKATAIRLLGSQANLARLCGVSPQAVSQMIDPIPELRAYQVRDWVSFRKVQKLIKKANRL